MRVVLGGGLGGLSAAHYLLKSAPSQQVLVIEASDRVGGWIRLISISSNKCIEALEAFTPKSSRHESGVLFELGPRTVRPRFEAGLNTLQLVEDLGLTKKVTGIPQSHPTARNRMIYVNGKLHTLPSSLFQALVTKPPFSRPLVSALVHDLRAAPHYVEDESIYNFVQRRFGQEIADYAVSSMICGICAGNAKEISVKFLMKSLFELEQKHGSVIGGFLKTLLKRDSTVSKEAPKRSGLSERAHKERWSVWSLEGGLEELPLSLLKSINYGGAEMKLNRHCSRIKFDNDGAIITVGRENIHASHVISTLPANKLAPLIADQHPDLSKELASIPFVNVAVVNLAYEGNILKQEAFGFLIPPCEEKPILGVIFDTCSFPQEGRTVLTAMMGGRWFQSRLGESPTDEMLLNIAQTQIASILDVKSNVFAHQVSVLRDCIPQYVVGHVGRVERIKNYIRKNKLPLSLAGSSFDGVGVNDVILSAKKAANEIVL